MAHARACVKRGETTHLSGEGVVVGDVRRDLVRAGRGEGAGVAAVRDELGKESASRPCDQAFGGGARRGTHTMTTLPVVGSENDLVGSSSLMATEGIDDPTSVEAPKSLAVSIMSG
jgi:hypothetical protein